MNVQAIDLDNCAREPIHIPGSIQPHGIMFVLREPGLTIAQVSENVSRILGVDPDELLDKPLSSFLDAEQEKRVRYALDSVDPRENNPVELQIPAKNGAGPLDGFVHRHEGFSFLELEEASLSYNARFLEFYRAISKLSSRLHGTTTLKDLLDEAALGIRSLTGFDRVMIYRFAENFDGEVVAEAKGELGESFLGLWFPASDIPEQARRLYVLNPVRAIADAGYAPSPLLPVMNPDTKRPTDLSFAGIRSVSPVHCQYMRNMGVAASMSISILQGRQLWGLIACHHLTPHAVSYEMRKACTFIGDVMASEIGRRVTEQEARYQSFATATQAKFLELMAGTPESLNGLINSTPNLLDLVPCQGAAIISADKIQMLGSVPGYDEIVELAEWIRISELHNTFATSCLTNHYGNADRIRVTASGLIALEVATVPLTYILLFRPEVVQTVTWAGDPTKPVVASEGSLRLSPRVSFEAWREEVRGHSLPWTANEIRVAGELRNLISVVLYSRGLAK